MIMNLVDLFEWLSLHAVALGVNAYQTVLEGVEKVSHAGYVETPRLVPAPARADRYRIVQRNTSRYTMQ
jgi:hypothetical protein